MNASPEHTGAARTGPSAQEPRIGRFLAGIGALLRRASDGRYLFLRRSLSKDYAAGDWECVTGRVDQGEGFTEAVHREIYEEVRLRARIEFIIGTTTFTGARSRQRTSCSASSTAARWTTPSRSTSARNTPSTVG